LFNQHLPGSFSRPEQLSHPFQHAGCQPLHTWVIQPCLTIQFALFGAGAEQNEPVLSSGTWEILMVRSAQVDTSLLSQYAGS
ncbi:hypothetical protein ACSLNO_28610, partial [Escherichia coli]